MRPADRTLHASPVSRHDGAAVICGHALIMVVVLVATTAAVAAGATITRTTPTSQSLAAVSPTRSLSSSRVLDGCTTAAYLQVDVATRLVTAPLVSTPTGTRIGMASEAQPIVNGTAGSVVVLPRAPTEVRGFICFDSDTTQAAADRMCYDTFGPGFTAFMGQMLWTVATGRADVLRRFPFFASHALLRLVCPDGVLSGNGTASADSTSLAACAVCNTTASDPRCSSLLTVSCRAPAVVQQHRYAPVRLLAPPQWANATVAVRSATEPPRWFAQATCPPLHVATVAAGYGVVGDAVSGFTSGLDTLTYGFLQFSVVCDDNASNKSIASSCWVQPNASADQVAEAIDGIFGSNVSLVNISQSMIVNCEPIDAATPPLNTQTPSQDVANCTFALWSLDGGPIPLEGGRPSSVDGYLHASCAGTTMGALPYHTCLDSSSSGWDDLVVPVCRASGFDHGVVIGAGSVAPVASTTTAFQMAPSTNTSYVLRLLCPRTYFVNKLLRDAFRPCGLVVVPVAVASNAAGTLTGTAACTARPMRCYDVLPPEPRVEWIVGTTIFCAALVAATAVSCVGTYMHRKARREAGEGLRRRSRVRLRALSRVSSSSASTMLGNSTASNLALPRKWTASAMYSPTASARGGGSSSADLHRSQPSDDNDALPEL